MSVPHEHLLPKFGSQVTTACKEVIFYEADTPTVVYHGQRIYFCLSLCLKAFQDDPQTSCLADEIKPTQRMI